MTGSLASGLLVSALLRRVNDAGGIAMVRVRGEADSGGILLIIDDKAFAPYLLERALDRDGKPELRPSGPDGEPSVAEIEAYWRKRRARDPDLWVVELDIASAERFAAETILGG